MKCKTSIACLIIISLFSFPAWCDEPRDISENNKEITIYFEKSDVKDEPQDISENNKEITIDFEKADVKEVLRILMKFANLDIIFDECVQGSLTLKASNVPLYDLFRMILSSARLDYEQDGDEIWITCKANSNTTTTDSN